MKKLAVLVAFMLAVASLFTGCLTPTPAPTAAPTVAPTQAPAATEAPTAAPTAAAVTTLYGMVTDAGTIDDKSFNQGTWEGLVKAGKEFNFTPKYLRPANAQPAEADYMTQIDALYSAGYKFMVLPGYKFATAVGKEQDAYKDCKFVCIDYEPTDENGKVIVGSNTVAIYYNEHESGFLAGVATALQLKDGEIGFIGGMEIPAVQRYNWGFQQGVAYANTNFGTTCTMKAEHVIYQGTFNDVAAGQQLAATMYDAGVKCIFTAAGGVGVGAINEAIARAKQGKQVWIVGVDVDQFDQGIYDTTNNKSVIITSAMKGVTQATYDMIKDDINGKFPGGQTLHYSAANGGVGIPDSNPNLSADVMTKVQQVEADLKAGKITVAAEQGSLIK